MLLRSSKHWKNFCVFALEASIMPLGQVSGVIRMGFWVDSWLHDIPDTEFDSDGKQVIIKHLCFGPLETRIWYKQTDGQYCHEIYFIEGIQEGERYTDFISKTEVLKVIEAEINCCKKYGETDLAALLQAEKEKINQSN